MNNPAPDKKKTRYITCMDPAASYGRVNYQRSHVGRLLTDRAIAKYARRGMYDPSIKQFRQELAELRRKKYGSRDER